MFSLGAHVLFVASIGGPPLAKAVEQSFQWGSILLGFCLLWLGVFTRPDEQKRYESIIVDWWVRITSLRKAGRSRLTAFLVGISEKTDRLFTVLFGSHLFSWRALGASIALSLSGALGVLAWEEWPNDIALLMIAVVFLPVGLLQAYAPRWWPLQLFLAVLGAGYLIEEFAGILGAVANALGPSKETGQDLELVLGSASVISLVIVLSFISDILFISLTRKLLRVACQARSALFAIAIVVGNAAFASTLIGAPWLLWKRFQFGLYWMSVAMYLSWFNILDAVVALVFFAVAILALADRVVWPPLTRLLEVANAEHILAHRRMLITLGVSLVGLGSARFGGILRVVVPGH